MATKHYISPSLITTSQAIATVVEWLGKNRLVIDTESHTLLLENRRNPCSDSAEKSGYPRGNRHKYGALDYIRRGNAVYYYRSVLLAWLEEFVRPQAREAA